MANISEVPRQDWSGFCERYLRQHDGWISSMEALDPDAEGTESAGFHKLASDLPLQALTLQQRPQSLDLLVSMGKEDAVLTHCVIQPESIEVLRSDSGLDEGLLIRAESGHLLRLCFRVPAIPEAVDGFAK